MIPWAWVHVARTAAVTVCLRFICIVLLRLTEVISFPRRSASSRTTDSGVEILFGYTATSEVLFTALTGSDRCQALSVVSGHDCELQCCNFVVLHRYSLV